MAVLEELPARVTALEVQLSQFRGEVRAEFAGTRSELRDEIRAGDEATRRELRGVIDDAVTGLRGEINAGDEETRRYMRVLHEEVIARIATIGERRSAPKKR